MTDSYELPYAASWRDRWGHYAPQLLSASIACAIALGFRQQAASELSLLGSLGLIVFVLATWVRMRAHDRRLCEACAAAMPLNPMQQATRYRRRFFVTHSGSNPYYLVPYLILLVGTNFLTSPIGRDFWALVQSTMIYLILSNSTHRKLQPWCPWCSGGGGGSEHEDVPEPTGPRGDTRQFV